MLCDIGENHIVRHWGNTCETCFTPSAFDVILPRRSKTSVRLETNVRRIPVRLTGEEACQIGIVTRFHSRIKQRDRHHELDQRPLEAVGEPREPTSCPGLAPRAAGQQPDRRADQLADEEACVLEEATRERFRVRGPPAREAACVMHGPVAEV